ncbi:MAG: T9SS type A sorting domain-containing protein [Bacteroidota bacterium]
MKKTVHLLIVLLTLLSQSFDTRASHSMGGELTYKWLQGNDYLVRYSFYRDCMGISAPTSAIASLSSSCDSLVTISLLPTASSPQILDITCPGFTTTCNGGTLNGIEKWVYEGTVTLSGPCSDWQFSVQECCRNGTITNLVQPSGEYMYLRATLDNLNTPFNSSPDFASDPVPYLYLNNFNTLNVGAADSDNDSLVVTLADALGVGGSPCVYNPGYSGLNPINTTNGIAVDPLTGNVSLIPAQQGVNVVAFLVQEYRNGVLIGSCRRDFQVTVVNSPNHLPSLSYTAAGTTVSQYACAGDTLSFTITSSDIDPNDSTFITISGGDLASVVSITNFGTQNDSIMVEMVVDGTLISPIPHRLILNVRDNSCPYTGSQSYCYNVYVSGCSQNIWPGDANNDLRCDLYDLLPIGIGNGSTGPVRTNASITWTAQTANDWTQSFISSVNYKFADCNGDGTIDANDTTAISQNYGLTHPVRLAPPTTTTNTATNLYLIASTNSAGPNDQLRVDVNLGDASNPASRMYGIAFRLLFNPILVDPSSSIFSFIPSQLGTPGVDLLTMVRTDWSAGIVEAVAVRMDGQEQSIDSTIAVFDVVIVDNVSARTVLNVDLNGVRGITSNGTNQYFAIVSDSVNVNSGTTGIHQPSGTATIVYPNPAIRNLQWTGIENVNGVVLRDLRGRKVYETDAGWSGNHIDISMLPTGSYIIEIFSDKETVRKKISVLH